MAPLILIAGDQPTRREDAAQALLREGFRVVQATSGGEALELFARERPAAVVLDLGAPPLATGDVEHILRSELAQPPVLVAIAPEERDVPAEPRGCPVSELGWALRSAGVPLPR